MKAVPLECKPCHCDSCRHEFGLFGKAMPLVTLANEITKGNLISPTQWFSRNKSDVCFASPSAVPLPLHWACLSLDSPYLKMDNRQCTQQLTSESYSVT